ncbi:DUF4399 domain-containing protein [Bradyrhizobium ontarionense]|uniref:DUF4399 domain-containing protein n=1 Tax=Bradyrhizobium ontarionense TaxID=2898149 RepID=A0ABY3R5U6_9BRAD|nr:DUF4399 domain-containing protein [Bradyrhizobium sp. A19]UFZ02675.1 DUF4399 domain-containing protein [Bradyrhizobium sp. A19]
MAFAAPLLLQAHPSLGEGTKAPKGAYVYIISPSDGDTVKRGFRCRFGLRNMSVTHAGDNFPGSGHHHLLIDTNKPIEAGQPIPHDKNHIHYAGGETEAVVELPPGKHTLQLALGDANHLSFDPPVVSEKIVITVVSKSGESRQDSHSTDKTGAKSRERPRMAGSRESRTEAVPSAAAPSQGTDFLKRLISPRK